MALGFSSLPFAVYATRLSLRLQLHAEGPITTPVDMGLLTLALVAFPSFLLGQTVRRVLFCSGTAQPGEQ